MSADPKQKILESLLAHRQKTQDAPRVQRWLGRYLEFHLELQTLLGVTPYPLADRPAQLALATVQEAGSPCLEQGIAVGTFPSRQLSVAKLHESKSKHTPGEPVASKTTREVGLVSDSADQPFQRLG